MQHVWDAVTETCFICGAPDEAPHWHEPCKGKPMLHDFNATGYCCNCGKTLEETGRRDGCTGAPELNDGTVDRAIAELQAQDEPDYLHPVMRAFVNLREDKTASADEKSMELFLSIPVAFSTYIDVAGPRRAQQMIDWLQHSLDTNGQCACRHKMCEAHLRHGAMFTPTPITEFAKGWTERDQVRAASMGWCLLLDHDDMPYVAAIPDGPLGGMPSDLLETRLRDQLSGSRAMAHTPAHKMSAEGRCLEKALAYVDKYRADAMRKRRADGTSGDRPTE